MSNSRCFFMPLLRTGDILFNAVAIQKRIVDRASVSDALVAVRGSVGGMARDLFGHNVTEISANLLGDISHADRLLRHHTLFGVFRHALSDPMIESWSKDLKAGRHLSSLQSLGASPSDLGALSTPSLRSCSACIATDRDLQGFATWKLTHQISAVDRCPDHGTLLDHESRPIGGAHARIWPVHLPGESIGSRPQHASLPPSDGYAAYLRLWQRVLTDELPWLKPNAWIQSMQATVSRLGGIDAATEAIETDISCAWGTSIAAISAALFLDNKLNPIREELLLKSRPRDIARRMLLHGSLDRLGLDLFDFADGDQRELLLSGMAEKRRPAVTNAATDRILELAGQCGFPLASVKLAELDLGLLRTAQAIGISECSLRKFAAIVEEDVLHNLMDSFKLSARSWVVAEIARRQRSATPLARC